MAKQYKSQYTGAQIDKAVGDVLNGRVGGDVPKERKVGGVDLQNDTANLQGYIWTEGQTMAQKMEAIDTAIEGKQDAITEDNKLDAGLVDGLEEELSDFVKKDTEIGGVALGDGIETVKDMLYDIREEEVTLPYVNGTTYNIKMSDIDIPDWPIDVPQDDVIYEERDGVWIGWYRGTFEEQDYICLNYFISGENSVDLYYNPLWNYWRTDEGEQYIGDPLTVVFNSNYLVNEFLFEKLVPKETETVVTELTLEDAVNEQLCDKLYNYETKTETVTINLVDDETYKFKKTYDPADFADFSSGILYGRLEDDTPISDIIMLQTNQYPVIQFSPFEFIDIPNQRYSKYYMYIPDGPNTCNWYEYIWDENEQDFVSSLYSGDIELVYNSLNATMTPDTFSQAVLNLTKEEVIVTPVTLKQKIDSISNIAKVEDRVVSTVHSGDVYRVKKTLNLEDIAYIMYRTNNDPYRMCQRFTSWYVDNERWFGVRGYDNNTTYVYNPNLNGWCNSNDTSTLIDYDSEINNFRVQINYDSDYKKYNYFCPSLFGLVAENLDGTPFIANVKTYKTISIQDPVLDWPVAEATVASDVTGYKLNTNIDWDALNAVMPSTGTIYYNNGYPYLSISKNTESGIPCIYVSCHFDNSSNYIEMKYVKEVTGSYRIADAWCDTFYYDEIDESGLYIDTYFPGFTVDTTAMNNREAFDLLFVPARSYASLEGYIESKTSNTDPLKNQLYGQELIVLGDIPDGSGPQLRPRYDVNFTNLSNLNIVLPSYSYNTNIRYLIYQDSGFYVEFFHTYRQATSYRTYEDAGFNICFNSIELIYYQMRNNSTINKWYKWDKTTNQEIEITDPIDLPVLPTTPWNADWDAYAKMFPLNQMSAAPFYWNCYTRNGYELVSTKPGGWDTSYHYFYYYDSDNDTYTNIPWSEEAPDFSAQDVYTESYTVLNSAPADWENIYYNGEYYYRPSLEGSTIEILKDLIYITTTTTFTLQQKLNYDASSGLPYITALPTSANTSGKLKIVVCSEEPQYKYDGYLYIITE